MDAGHKTALTNTSLANYKAGDKVTVYWTYNHGDSNFVNGKQGSVVVTVKEAESVLPVIPGGNSDNGSSNGGNDSNSGNISSKIIDSSVTSPDTGANENVLFWSVMMLVSALALTTILVASKKKKIEK